MGTGCLFQFTYCDLSVRIPYIFLSFSLFDFNKGTSIKSRILPYIIGFVIDSYKSNSAKVCDVMSILIIYHMHRDYQKYMTC